MKTFYLLIFIVIPINILIGQTYQAGKYKILLENNTYYDITNDLKIPITTDKIFVKLVNGSGDAVLSDFINNNSLTLLKKGISGIHRFGINNGLNFINVINALSLDDNVEQYYLNHIYTNSYLKGDLPEPPTNNLEIVHRE